MSCVGCAAYELGGWVAGPVIIVPLCGSILQAETCHILSLAENPRWSPSVAIIQERCSWELHQVLPLVQRTQQLTATVSYIRELGTFD